MAKFSDEALISALLTTGTATGAARELGVDVKTITRRLGKEQFKQRYDKAKNEQLEATALMLQSKTEKAVETLAAVLSDGEHDTARINAAKCVLDYSLKYTELANISARLSMLESRVNDEK